MIKANTTILGRLGLVAASIAVLSLPVFAGGATNPGAPQSQLPAANPGVPGQDSAAAAADAATVAASTSDWPCVQVKVQKIDSAAVWDGPSIADLKNWSDDDAISDVVVAIVNRGTPLADAEKQVETYAKTVPEGERDGKLTLLFAGVLDRANMQRSSILNGIERYQKRQRQNAKEIESQGAAIADLESKAPSDLTVPTPELDQAREKYDWFARVFQERQSNLPIACELPTLIEQRVFALSRAIRAQMKS